MRLTTSLMKLEEQILNAINNNMKVIQLKRCRINVIKIKDVMEVDTEAEINEPFKGYVKLVEVKTVHDTSADVEKLINVEVLGIK